MITIEIGKQYIFDYPHDFKTLPDHTAHAGQIVTVVSLSQDGQEEEVESLYHVVANDGWTGEAFESELVDLPT